MDTKTMENILQLRTEAAGLEEMVRQLKVNSVERWYHTSQVTALIVKTLVPNAR